MTPLQTPLTPDTPVAVDAAPADRHVPLSAVSALDVPVVSDEGEVVPFMGDAQPALKMPRAHAAAMTATEERSTLGVYGKGLGAPESSSATAEKRWTLVLMTQESETEVWTVHAAGGRDFRCVMRFAAGGVEVAISDGTELIASRIFPSGTEAYAWAEDVREELSV